MTSASLTVTVDRLERWYRPGLLCIGDAAHAMSPIGGVGINLAVQDAVAAANLLAGPLRAGRVTTEDLARVERRRLLPTRITQWIQVVVQRRVIAAVLGGRLPSRPPLPCGSSHAPPCSAASPPGSSAWASAPSTSTRRSGLREYADLLAAGASSEDQQCDGC